MSMVFICVILGNFSITTYFILMYDTTFVFVSQDASFILHGTAMSPLIQSTPLSWSGFVHSHTLQCGIFFGNAYVQGDFLKVHIKYAYSLITLFFYEKPHKDIYQVI